MPVEIIECDTFEAFVDELRGRHAIRLAKLADYGFLAPLGTSTGAVVMAPQLKVVATAFDNDADALIRWQSSTPSGKSNPTAAIQTVKSVHGDVKIAARKDDLRKWLELEGYSVSDGEWTAEEIERLTTKRIRSRRGA
jgi:hypothetical protein